MKYDIKDRINNNKNNKKEDRVYKFNLLKIIKIIFIIFIVIFIILFYMILIFEDITGYKLLYPSNIIIKGLTIENEEEFIYKNNLKKLIIFNFFSKKFKDEIKSLYYVKDLKVKYKPLNTIILEIYEKEKSFILYDENEGSFYYVSKDGYILDKCITIDLLNYLIISFEGIEPKIGKKIDVPLWVKNVKDDYNKIFSQIKIKSNNEIIVFINNTSFYAKVGNYFSKEKIENLILISKIIKENSKIKFVDLSIGNIGRIVEKD